MALGRDAKVALGRDAKVALSPLSQSGENGNPGERKSKAAKSSPSDTEIA